MWVFSFLYSFKIYSLNRFSIIFLKHNKNFFVVIPAVFSGNNKVKRCFFFQVHMVEYIFFSGTESATKLCLILAYINNCLILQISKHFFLLKKNINKDKDNVIISFHLNILIKKDLRDHSHFSIITEYWRYFYNISFQLTRKSNEFYLLSSTISMNLTHGAVQV